MGAAVLEIPSGPGGGVGDIPVEMGTAEVVAFLNHLANVEHVAAATQNQALNAISFLYGQVLRLELGDLGEFLAASKRRRVPVVLSIKGSVLASFKIQFICFFGSHRDIQCAMRAAWKLSTLLTAHCQFQD